MIAPVVVVVLLSFYYIALSRVLIALKAPAFVSISAGIVSIAVSALLVYVLIERIKEIRKGEEDDLGNY